MGSGIAAVVMLALMAVLVYAAHRDGRREGLEEAASVAREMASQYERAPISNAFTDDAARIARRERNARVVAAREVATELEDIREESWRAA